MPSQGSAALATPSNGRRSGCVRRQEPVGSDCSLPRETSYNYNLKYCDH